MADLIAIGYPDETTALSAMDETERLQQELSEVVLPESELASMLRLLQSDLEVTLSRLLAPTI